VRKPSWLRSPRWLRRGLPLAVAVLLLAGIHPGIAGVAGDGYEAARRAMVDQQIRHRGIGQENVLKAMETVPRHLFVPDDIRPRAYDDQALPIGSGRAIYQPYVVALMTALLGLKDDAKVLEVGTGSGYQAAVLSRVAHEVYSIEIVPTVANQARSRLAALGYDNVTVRAGDGYQGWPDKAPFDAILISVAPPSVPKPLLKQLRVGGKMVVPVGGFFQDLLVITKTADGLERRTVIPVRLASMTGKVRDGH
jgi:protein-L-isoaspartate(D-aspartate) O-methyltransferase